MQLVPSEQHCEDPQVRVPEPARVAEAHHLAARLVFRRHRSPQKQREKGGHPVLEVRTFLKLSPLKLWSVRSPSL